MKSSKTVFVDCNDTVIAVRYANRGEEAPEGFRAFERDGQWYHVKARPSAAAFLSALADEECDIVILTGGHSRMQHLILNFGKLGRLYDDLIGADHRDPVALPEKWVLVDDLQGGSSSFEEKLSMLGISKKTLGEAKYKALVERHCIQCAAFKGGEDSEPLTGLLDSVKAKLGAQ